MNSGYQKFLVRVLYFVLIMILLAIGTVIVLTLLLRLLQTLFSPSIIWFVTSGLILTGFIFFLILAIKKHRSLPPWPKLVEAACGGDIEAVEALVKNGTDLEVKGSDGNTALMMAAGSGHYPVGQMLLQAGADVNARNDGGATALLFAVQEGHQDIVQLLIASGADVNIACPDGTTALSVATDSDLHDIRELLKKAGAKTGNCTAPHNRVLPHIWCKRMVQPYTSAFQLISFNSSCVALFADGVAKLVFNRPRLTSSVSVISRNRIISKSPLWMTR